MDREKVYFVNGGKFTKMEMVCKALQQCTMPSDLEGYDTQCADCPYFDPDCFVDVCKQQLCEDALALLKEQEHKKGSWDYGTQCSVCKGTIVPPQNRKTHVNFCPWCGADMRDSYK